MAAAEMCVRSSRELWTILIGRSALRDPTQIEAELDRNWERLLSGLSYYKPPRYVDDLQKVLSVVLILLLSASAEKLKADKDVAPPMKDFGFRISKFLGLDEQQSVQILQCYLQEDYRGTRDALKVFDYYYEERMCMLRCVLLLLTYFQDERHPYRAEYSKCVDKLEKELVFKYRHHFEQLFRAEAPSWETHLMTERQVSRWFLQCLREQALLLEIIFLYYAYFEMAPNDLLAFTKIFKDQGFGSRQTNRHLVDKSMDALIDRIGYFSSLILVEGMDIDFLHKCALEDRTEEHQFANTPAVCKEMDQLLQTFGDIPHHAPVLLAWVLLRHTLSPDESSPVIRRIGNTSLQLSVFQYLTSMLKALGGSGNNCTASTARMCVYGLISFVITSFEEDALGSQQHLIDAACEVLAAPSLAELFWETKPTLGLGMILDSAMGMFPQKIGPLLQLLTALLSDKSTAKRVYSFLDKMSYYTEVYKRKPNDILSHEDETIWRRQTPKLIYPLGLGQTNLRMPLGTLGQVVLGEQGYMVRWDYSYSCWTLFTCEIEMLLHVVSTAVLAARMPAKVWADLHHTGFLPFASSPVTSIAQSISAEGMKAGNYGNLLILIEQPQGEYAVTIAFLRLITTLVKGQLGSTQNKGLIPCVLLVLKEMLPTYHKWRYNAYGVRERIGCLILELIHAILNLNPEGEGSAPSLQSLCIYSLANTEAGQAVVNIMGVGVDTIDVVMAAQPSSGGSEGPGQMLIQTVKLAFSVTNNVIRLKPPSDNVSPLEQALTQHGGHGNNLIAILAKYIYHKHDPALPRLAIQLLKRLATVYSSELCVASLLSPRSLAGPERQCHICTAHQSDVMQLTDGSVREQLFLDVLSGTKAALLVPMSVPCLRLGSMLATLLLILLKQWKSVLVSAPDILDPLVQVLESILQADQQLMERTKAKVFSALLSVLQSLQQKEDESPHIPQLPQLLLSVCETAQEETLALLDSTRHAAVFGESVSEDKDSMETDTAPRALHKDQRDGVCVLALHLAKELCKMDVEGDHWLQVMRKLPVIPSILGTLELSLRLKQNLHFTEAALHLLLTMSHTQQGAAAVAGAGVIQSICLPLLSVHEISTNGASQSSGFSRKSQDAPSWPGVHRLSISLMESLLKTLRYNFLNDALDFVGVHQERILQCLNAVRTVQSLACLDEADHTVGFLLQLSHFCKEWQFHLPQLLRDVQVNLCYLCQTCTYLLHSKKMLRHYLQTKNGDAIPAGPLPRSQRAPQTPSKQPSSEEEQTEHRALQTVQCSLLKILSKTLAALRHFTPDFCQILLDQSLDLAQYNILFVLSFTTPAFESDVAPSFGTLLATINVSLSMLGEVEKKKEPAPSNVGSSFEETKPVKSLLMFSMENCFHVLISQAVRYLKDPTVHLRDKQRMKQELSSELSTLLSSLNRYFRRGSPSSPAGGLLPSPQGKPSASGSKSGLEGQDLIQLVQAFVKHVQR
ncbi:UNVERIFIED_CONTAM: hypothetical protein FKN15_022816 [Acipenser sinensis]